MANVKDVTPYKLCGFNLTSDKNFRDENEELFATFDLKSSHYYVYNVDTPSEVTQ